MNQAIAELLPRKVRLLLYVLVALTALVIGTWQQAEGNTLAFVIALATTLTNVLAAVNVNPPEQLPITLEDASIDYIVDVFEERGITVQELVDAGLHLNARRDPAPPNLGQ